MNQIEAVDHLPYLPSQPRRRRWRLWVGIPLILLVLWLAVVYGFFAYWTDRELREAMAEADRDNPEAGSSMTSRRTVNRFPPRKTRPWSC